MRKALILGATGALFAGIAAVNAADMPLKARPAPFVASFNWTGLYVGGNAGGHWGRSDFDPTIGQDVTPFGTTNFTILVQQVSGVFIPGRGVVVVPGTTRDLPPLSARGSGFVGGGQIGYNYQTGRWVFGVEGDGQGTSGARTATFTTLLPFTALTQPSPITITRRFETEWMASLRLRVGYAPWERVLLYGTGGLALAGGKVTSTDNFTIAPGPGAPPQSSDIGPSIGYPSTTGTAVDKQIHTGWTIGVGGDWAVTDNIILGILYRHSDFGTKTYNVGTNTLGTQIGFATAPGLRTTPDQVKFTDDQVTARASWRFGAR